MIRYLHQILRNMYCKTNDGLLGYEFPGEGWFRGISIGKLHQAGTVLFPLSENKKL